MRLAGLHALVMIESFAHIHVFILILQGLAGV